MYVSASLMFYKSTSTLEMTWLSRALCVDDSAFIRPQLIPAQLQFQLGNFENLTVFQTCPAVTLVHLVCPVVKREKK